jgi:hypothetical protein
MIKKPMKLVSICTVFLMLFTMIMPTYAMFSDVSGNWASPIIDKWESSGVLKGNPDGTFAPNNPVKRSEFVAVINFLFGYIDTAGLTFTDVNKTAWYAEDVSKAVAAGIIQGDGSGKFNPNAAITRQEAALVICRAFDLKVVDKNASNKFKDVKDIAAWSKDAVSTLFEKGYISGRPDNKFGPKENLTRAECIKIIDSVAGELKNKAGTYTGTVAGSLVVNTGAVILKDMTINGDLYLAQGIGSGKVTLDNVTVKGRTVVRGGGITLNGDFDSVSIGVAGISVNVSGGTIGSLSIDKNAAGAAVNIDSTATVTTLTADSAVAVSGTGKITTANVNVAGVTIEQKPTTSNVKEGVTATIAGIATTANTVPVAPPASSITLSAINIISGTAKVGVILAAGALAPTGATASYQWQICDTVAGASVNIDGARANTYTPVSGDVNKFIKVVATGIGSYFGTVSSAAIGPVAKLDNPALTVAPVDLGMAGNYAILAKTGISTVPNSVITGNIGVSPVAASYITEFGLTADSTNVFSKSTQVIGNVYASDYTSPTPENLTTAVNNMLTAYTDAAGRAANYTELYTGDISGKTLTAGVYKWGTDVLINTDVTLNGGANDVWIFQIAKGITQATGTKIILSGGAQAKNIFWQAAETVAIGTDAHFEGIILGMKEITLGTNASINGRMLAQTAVTLISSTVTAPR